MARQDDAPTPKEAEEHKEVPPEEAEHAKRINPEKDHAGFGEDIKPDAQEAEPSGSTPPGA